MRRRPGLGAVLARSGHTRRSFFGPFKKREDPNAPAGAGKNPFNFNFQEMEKEIAAAKAAGVQPPKPLLKMTEKNLQMMKALLNAQDKVKGSTPAGLGGALNKNEDFLKNLIRMQEMMLQQNPTSTLPGQGQTPTPPIGDGTKVASPSAGTPQSTTSGPSAGSTQNGASSKPQIDLGPETEELFAELRSMREKKNDYKRQLESKSLAYAALEADFSKAEEASKDLRDRLRRAEKDVALLNSESLDLKEQLREYKQLKQKVVLLEGQVTSLKSQDAAPSLKKVDELERQLADKNEALRSVSRKLDRSKRGNPALQLSAFVSDVGRAAGPFFDSSKVDEAILGLQDAYSTHLSEQWNLSDAQRFEASKPIELACVEFVARRLPRSTYDATFVATGDVSGLIQTLSTWGFSTTADTADPTKYWVTIRIGTEPKSNLGPYGALYALSWAQQQQQQQQAWRLSKVSPAITADMVNNKRRCSTRVETSRSSKPGGQATNVGETHIRVLLLIDGEMVMVSEAQDTRSAHTNKEYAWCRLFEERIPSHNAKLETMDQPLVADLTLKDDPSVARVSRTRWDETLKPLQFSDPVAAAAVGLVAEATRI